MEAVDRQGVGTALAGTARRVDTPGGLLYIEELEGLERVAEDVVRRWCLLIVPLVPLRSRRPWCPTCRLSTRPDP